MSESHHIKCLETIRRVTLRVTVQSLQRREVCEKPSLKNMIQISLSALKPDKILVKTYSERGFFVIQHLKIGNNTLDFNESVHERCDISHATLPRGERYFALDQVNIDHGVPKSQHWNCIEGRNSVYEVQNNKITGAENV